MLLSPLRSSTRLVRRNLSTQALGVLSRLNISVNEINDGVYNGSWGGSGTLQRSVNPATGELIATVRQASAEDVIKTLELSRVAYKEWRNVPAPRRGEILRQIRLELSKNIIDLGTLVSLEMGKIHSEGKGEVQEFVDICDWAVGLSRGFGGTVVPSERSKHFITEVANPLGVVGVSPFYPDSITHSLPRRLSALSTFQ